MTMPGRPRDSLLAVSIGRSAACDILLPDEVAPVAVCARRPENTISEYETARQDFVEMARNPSQGLSTRIEEVWT